MTIITLLFLMIVAQGMGQSCTSIEINKALDDVSKNLLRYKYHPELTRENWDYSGQLPKINCTKAEWKYHLLQLPTLSRLHRVITEWTFLSLRDNIHLFKYYISEWKSKFREETLGYYSTEMSIVRKLLKDNVGENWTFPEIVLHFFSVIGGIGKTVGRVWDGYRLSTEIFNENFYVNNSVEFYCLAIAAYYIFKLVTFGSWFWNM